MTMAGGRSSLPTSSAYGAGSGGVGGKFEKRSSSKGRSTPYNRPLTALGNSNWISKLLLDPASKLVAASARRFFSSVFRKRLPPPYCPQLFLPPVVNPDVSNGLQDSHIPTHSEVVQSAAAADSQSLTRKDNFGISELEQLLKQKTLTRHEINRSTELLQSKTVDLPVKNDARRDASSPLKTVKLKDFWLGNTRDEGGSPQITPTPESSARINTVLGEDITVPAEMCSHGQAIQENRSLLSNFPSSPSSSVMSLEMTTTGQVNVWKNGFPIQSSRGRSAIYRMAGTSYLRTHQTTTDKASECNGRLSASPTLLKQNGGLGRKRSSVVLDDDVGSVEPIRRTRETHGLVSHKASLPFGGKDVSEEANKASTSYSHVPPKSHETALPILQNDENMKQKEKSSESKLVTTVREKSPSKSTTYIPSGQGLKSFQSADSLKLLEGTENGKKSGDLSRRSSTCTHGFNYQKQKRADESSSVPCALPTVPLAQVTRKNHGFKMSVDEDFFDLDEDAHCNEPAAESSVKEREHKTLAFVETRKTHVEPQAVSENSSVIVGASVTSFAFPILSLPEKPLQPVVHPLPSSFEKPKYVESSLASVSEVSTPKFSSRTEEPIPSSSSRPGGAINHSLQVPGSGKHEENDLEEDVKAKERPETQISVPFSSSISSSISASVPPEPSNINNGPSTNSSTPVASNADAFTFKNKEEKVANVTSSAIVSPFDNITSATLLNTKNGLDSHTDSSTSKSQHQVGVGESGSIVGTVPDKIPLLFGSPTLTSAGTSGVSSIAPFSSSSPTNLSESGLTFGSSGLSASAVVINGLSNVATTSNTMPSSTSGTSHNPVPVAVTFGPTFNSSSMFSFGATSTLTAPSTGSMAFGAAATSDTIHVSSFPTTSASPSPFTNFPPTFTTNSNNDQMNPGDSSMAEDPVQSQPQFVEAAPMPFTPAGFTFGNVAPPAAAPVFQLGGQQSQSLLLQGPGSIEINNVKKFSCGITGGDDKSSRRIVKAPKNRLRKK